MSHPIQTTLFALGLGLVLGRGLGPTLPQQDPAAAPSSIAVGHLTGPWEYEVVGLTEIYSGTFDYLKGALKGDGENEGTIKEVLGFGKKVDDQLVAKTRDLLNQYGAEGWELAEYRENVLIFKRPK